MTAGRSQKRQAHRVWLAILLAGALLGCGTAQGRRLALVIGNDHYKSATPLQNARADARAVAAALERVGFTVILKEDLSLKGMKDVLRAFKGQISGGDEVLFYFSGHGVQFEGTNYLIPTDLMPESEAEVVDDSVPLQRILDDLRDQKTRFALAIIDACRNNPFKGTGRAIGGRGLAPVTAATGQMVLYSAGAGQEALDRLGDRDPSPNGVFTRVLIREIGKPGVPVDQMLKNVRNQVVVLARQVGHEQVPALYDQSIGEFYFVPPPQPRSGATTYASGPAAAASTGSEASADNPQQTALGARGSGSGTTDSPYLREVHNGARDKVGAYYSINPQCQLVGYPKITVIRAPRHGRISTQKGESYPTAGHPCHRQLVAATEIFYQSTADFRGEDAFAVQIRFATGKERTAWYTIDVR